MLSQVIDPAGKGAREGRAAQRATVKGRRNGQDEHDRLLQFAGRGALQRPMLSKVERQLRFSRGRSTGRIAMRAAIEQLPGSRIREVANAGIGRSDVLAFWFGESDEPTPEFIRQAAVDSLARGETFYSHNLGLPELRDAIARYTTGLHREVTPDRIAVTSSGVSALMIAMQALAGAGDEVVVVEPVWPNLPAQPAILGAVVKPFALQVEDGAWKLDLDALLAGRHRTHARVARQRAEQPDRLDADARRAGGDPRALPSHRHLDRRRRGLRARVVR